MQAARIVFLSLALAFAAIGGAAAQSGAWVVAQSDGAVRVVSAGEGVQPASLNASLRPGDIITTGGDGYAVLRRGAQQIVVSANSRMSLPAEQQGGFTHVVQELGTLMFKVDKRAVQHFEVDTPIVAAVVKGTTFTVTSGPLGDSVHVAEGLVEVRTHVGGAVANVPGGSTVFVSKDRPDVITFERSDNAPVKGDGESKSLQKADNAPNGAQHASLADERLIVAAAIGAEPLDLSGLTDGLVSTGVQARPASPTGAVQTVLAGVSSTLSGATGGALNVTTSIDTSGGLSAGVGADLGGGAVTASADVGLGGGGLTAGLDVGVGGSTSGVNLGAGATAGAGGVGVDLSAGVGGTTVDLGAGVGGGSGVTAGLGVGGAGGGGLSVDLGLGGGGGLDVGLGLGGAGVDLGLGGSGSGGTSGSSGSGSGGGGLLGGLGGLLGR
ncbi:MAG: FecR domain-containing protein [Pseudomonadota bacterium]|nr:FecR domain-containing protein [Pseudomonadota bacterium]